MNDILKPVKKVSESAKTLVKTKDEKPESSEVVPRITNDTVAEHREEVLKGARKYIYPLKHSKNRILIITTTIVVIVLVAFFTYCTLALYRYQSYSTFLYKVTQVVPFPIARVDGHFVSYNSYLFELEHYTHYYQTQQGVNFSTTSGQEQLNNYRSRALDKVIDDAYIQELASKNHVTVTNAQINNEINTYRVENRLGSNEAEFQDVLKTYWGWSVNDFKRELKTQLLAQNVVSALDTQTHQTAQSVYSQLVAGGNFSTLAQQYSQDTQTKGNSGQYPYLISQNDVNVPPQVSAALFSIKPGKITPIINVGGSLEIDKNLSVQGNQIQAAHIVFVFQDINNYLNPLKAQQPAKSYISPK